MRLLLLVILFLGLMAMPASAKQVVDAIGRKVGGEEIPQRVVSLVPAVTEILYALGQQDRIVGVTNFCNYPAAARAKARIGDYANPSLEVLAAMDPDLVFMAADMSSPELLHRLEALEIEVYVVYPRKLDETARLIRDLGRLLDCRLQADALADELVQAADCARILTADLPRVRVLCTVMSEPLVVAGRNTLLDDLISLAGGTNVVPEGLNRYPTWGIESVLAADPDVILVSPHPGQADPSAFYRDWPELTAVQTGRLVAIDADWIQRPGPRLVLGLAALLDSLHGVELPREGGPCRH